MPKNCNRNVLSSHSYSQVKPSHMLLFIWKVADWGLANPLKHHEPSFLLLCCLYVVGVLSPEIKLWDQICSPQQLAAPPSWLPADWELQHTKNEKVWIPWAKGPHSGLCTPWLAWGKRNGSVSRPGPLEWWKDNSPPHPHPTAAGPHAASNHLWAVTEPDWAERIWVGNFKTCSCFCWCERICITHSDLMDFPMFSLDSPFLLTCWNNESLMCRIPLSLLHLSFVSSCEEGMQCRPLHRLSQTYGEPLTCWLSGNRVSSSSSHWAEVCLFISGFQELCCLPQTCLI